MTTAEQVAVVGFLVLATLAYWTPTAVACARGHNRLRTAWVNGLFGWTGVGWFAALLVACERRRYYRPAPAPVEIHHHYPMAPPAAPQSGSRPWATGDAIPPSES